MQEATRLAFDNITRFEESYRQFFKPLLCYAASLLNDDSVAEEMVQNVFLKIWDKKEQIDIHTSLQAYLYKSVYFECLNYMEHKKVKKKHIQHIMHNQQQSTENKVMEELAHKSLQTKFREALEELPAQCRLVFQLSRFEELKYREIAERLNISEKTVENHIGKALKLLRLKLVDFLPLILSIIHHKNHWQ